jgi:3'(2'), 5'-bisphosphate nucleotidase
VHVALAIDGVPEIGAVALPGLGEVLRSDAPALRPLPEHRSAWSSAAPAPPPKRCRCREAGRGTGADGQRGRQGDGGDPRRGRYLSHTGGQYEWDSCAPAAVAAAHGLHVSRIDGSPLVYNQPDVYMPDLLICRKEHARPVLDLIMELAA